MLLSVKGVGQVTSISLSQSTICFGDATTRLVINSNSDTWIFVERYDYSTLEWVLSNNPRQKVTNGVPLNFSILDFYNTAIYRVNYASNQGVSLSSGTTFPTELTLTVRSEFLTGAISTSGETICYNGNPGIIGSATASSGGDGSITYKWQSSILGNFTDAIDIASSNTATYDPPTGLTTTTTYRRLASDGTCNTTATTSTGVWQVTVRPQFLTGAIVTTGETICYNGNPGLIGSATASSGGDGSITYKWQSSILGNFSDAIDISSSNAATYDPPTGLTTTTTYRRLANDGTCNTTLTESTGVWQVTVRPQFLTGSIAATGETICYNGNPGIIGSATASSGGDGSITYKWQSSILGNFSDAIDISSSIAATYDPPTGLTTTTTYRRLASDGTCNTTATASTGVWQVTANPLPPAPTVTDKEYCFNEIAVPLTATNLANHNLGWYGTVATGGTSASTAPTPLTNIVGSSIYYVSQTNNANSCESPRAAININIKALPPTPTITSNSPVCEGSAITLNTANIAGAIYYWEGVNGFTSAIVNPSINNATSAIAGNYTLKIKVNGCVSPLSTPFMVAVNPIPTAPTISSNSPIEEDKTLNLTASNLTGASYAWSGPNGYTSNIQNPAIIASFANAGSYYAALTLNGCTSANSSPIVVVVTPKSSPVFQIPNAFTPNSDGHNDTFKIIQNGYVTSIISFRIFTKSGKLIFSNKDGAWDGRYAGVMLDADVYIWIADFINKFNDTEHLSGTVLLLK